MECLRCGKCCKEVMLSEEDFNRISASHENFFMEKDNSVFLKTVNGKCMFFHDNKCEIYSIRPDICKVYDCDCKSS